MTLVLAIIDALGSAVLWIPRRIFALIFGGVVRVVSMLLALVVLAIFITAGDRMAALVAAAGEQFRKATRALLVAAIVAVSVLFSAGQVDAGGCTLYPCAAGVRPTIPTLFGVAVVWQGWANFRGDAEIRYAYLLADGRVFVERGAVVEVAR